MLKKIGITEHYDFQFKIPSLSTIKNFTATHINRRPSEVSVDKILIPANVKLKWMQLSRCIVIFIAFAAALGFSGGSGTQLIDGSSLATPTLRKICANILANITPPTPVENPQYLHHLEPKIIKQIIKDEQNPVGSLIGKLTGFKRRVNPSDDLNFAWWTRDFGNALTREVQEEGGAVYEIEMWGGAKFTLKNHKPVLLLGGYISADMMAHEQDHFHYWIKKRNELVKQGYSANDAADEAFSQMMSANGTERIEQTAVMAQLTGMLLEDTHKLVPQNVLGFLCYPEAEKLKVMIQQREKLNSIKSRVTLSRDDRNSYREILDQQISQTYSALGAKFRSLKTEVVYRLEEALSDNPDPATAQQIRNELATLSRFELDNVLAVIEIPDHDRALLLEKKP